jgi:hypothetical protein
MNVLEKPAASIFRALKMEAAGSFEILVLIYENKYILLLPRRL